MCFQLGCCGTNGPQYYNSSIPVSCCPSSLTNLQQLQNLQQDSINVTGLTNSTSGSLLSCSAAEANERGCVDMFMELLAKILKISGHVLIWVAVIEVNKPCLLFILLDPYYVDKYFMDGYHLYPSTCKVWN